MASEQMGMPAAAPSAEEMAVFDQMRQNISPKEFSDEMLAGASQVDPQAVAEFKQELDGLDMPPEVLDALNDLVDEILANPERYDEIRQQYIEQGIPDDFLPEQFDPQFFAALNMAIDQMIGAPAGPQAFAKGGIAELKPIAKAIASYGRNGDTMLAHITPAEARMLKRRGGSGTINPKTGLPEFFIKKIFKSVGKALKKVGNAVKKFASSTVGRVITTVALGFFLGPAAASMLGVSSAAGVAAVSGFVGSAGSTLMAGGNLRDALKAGAVGGITAGVGAGIMGGSEAFTAGSYTGPTTVGGQFERFKSAISPTSLQQAAAPVDATALEGSLAKAPVPGAEMAPPQAPGIAPVPEVGAPMGPDNIDVGGGWSPAGQPPAGQPSMPTESGIAPPIDVTATEGPLAKLPGTVGPESITDRFKGYFDKLNPSKIQEAGAIKAEQAGIKAMEAMRARLPNATPAMLENAYQTAYKATMPGVIGTYGPMAAVGIGALGAAGGFEPKPAELTPEAKMMRDRLQREEQMMRDNPGMFTPTGMERFGAVYNDKGQIIKWNPWTPESAGAFEQYKSPLRFPMFAPPLPPPLPIGAGMGGAGGRGYAKGGLASLAGGGMPGYAEGGDVQAIRDWWAANEGKGTQADLDRWLATSGYSAAQINEALPQFSVTDLNKAIQEAQARQEVIDREARRTALREQYPNQEMIVTGPGDFSPTPPSTARSTTSAIPPSEIEASRQRLVEQDPELAAFMEWRLGEMDPMFHQRIGERAAQYNWNPYDLSEQRFKEWKDTVEDAKRRAAMGGDTPEWLQEGWRERQAARNAAYDAEQERLRQLAQNSPTVVGPFVTGPGPGGGGGGGGTTTPPPPSAPPPSGPPTFPPTNPPPVAPPPPPPPTIPPPVTPPSPGQIPWNMMPDFQRYVEATAGSPIRPTFSVLGNYVQGPQDPFGAGKNTPIYSQMGAPAAPPGGASSMTQDSSINLPQYMFAPPPVTQQPSQISNPATWYGSGTTGSPTDAMHTVNPGQTMADTQTGLDMVQRMATETWTPGAFTPPTNIAYQPDMAMSPTAPQGAAPTSPLLPPSYAMQSLSPINTTYQSLTDFIMPEQVISRAHGGIAALASGGYPRRTGQISGPGTETSDSIPAMLSDGEFVMTAKAVRGAGNGSRREGAKKMYALMHRLEKNAARG